MDWFEIIATILMIAGGITLGSLVTMFITYKVMLSDRVIKKVTKASIKMSKKITKEFMKEYTDLIEE